MFRFIPASFSGRLMALLIGGLLIIQVSSYYYFQSIRSLGFFKRLSCEMAQDTSSTYNFMMQLTPQERITFVTKLKFDTHQFIIVENPDFYNGADEYSEYFNTSLQLLLPYFDDHNPNNNMATPHVNSKQTIRTRVDRFGVNWSFTLRELFPQTSKLVGNIISAKAAIPFDDGTWLSVEFNSWRAFTSTFLVTVVLFIQLLLQVLLAYVAIRYLTSPLRQLAFAADKLSPDDPECPPLPRKGPSEVLHAAQTFKAMHARIRAFVNERMSLLASLSHDLRSPVARLRVQIEKEPQLEDRRLMLDALDDLQQLMEDTIDLARCGQNREPAVPLNMGSLVESVAHDYMDAGKNVRLEGESRSCCLVRISAIRRCLENLIDNALRYGKSACIRLEEDENAIRISILDDGPGIPEEHFESVFQPFYRLERSRNKTTGGTGLGLTIAQGLARLHGSEIKLANRPEGGLCVSFSLLIWQASNGGSESTAGRG